MFEIQHSELELFGTTDEGCHIDYLQEL